MKTAYATLVGETVASRYRVVGEVGRTDFGVLYLAEDILTPGRSVAINVISGELPALEADRRRFELDTEALARRADIDLTDFINAGRLPDGRPFWVLACEAVVPELITPEDLNHAVTPAPEPETEVARRLDRYEYVPVFRRRPFVLLVYALPVLLAVIASVGVKVVGTDEPARPTGGFDRHLNYSIWAQRYRESLPVGDPTRIELPVAFAPEERVRLEFATPEEGYLYVIHDVAAQQRNGVPSYRVLFPQANSERAAYVQSTTRVVVPAEGHLDFETGDQADRVWVIWSSLPLEAFDGLPRDLQLDSTHTAAIQQLIARRAGATVSGTVDATSKRVQLVSKADPWVHLISLARQ